MLEDIATLTAGRVISEEVGFKLENATVDDLGTAKRVVVDKDNTTIIEGGGVTFIRALPALDTIDAEEDEQIGVNILKRVLEEPIRQIAENAGREGSIVVKKVKDGNGAFGYNAATDVYEDLNKAGVIDPAKVTRIALENAASVAALMLMTEATIVEKPEKSSSLPIPPGGGMDDMY